MWLYELTRRLRPLWSLYWTFEVVGEVGAVPRVGPALVAANHSSFLDPWMLGVPFPRNIRQLINRRWYERSALWRAAFDANGTVPVEPNDPERTLAAVSAAFERGDLVGIFPEGKISDDGRVRRFRSGVAYIAARTGVPVIPVGIRGARESLPRERRWPRRGRIEIHVGAPLRFAGDPEDVRALARFRDRVRDEVVRLCGQAERRSGAVARAGAGP